MLIIINNSNIFNLIILNDINFYHIFLNNYIIFLIIIINFHYEIINYNCIKVNNLININKFILINFLNNFYYYFLIILLLILYYICYKLNKILKSFLINHLLLSIHKFILN